MSALHVRWSNVLLLLICLSFLFLASGCASTQNATNGAEKIQSNTLTVKGRVQKISPAEGVIVVAPPKGDHVTLKISEQTPVKGGSIKDIIKFHPVRVIYTVEGGQNSAVSIEILPQGSCG